MKLLEQILEWSQSTPNWQRDAARRLLNSQGDLTQNDYDELFQLLKLEHGLLENPTCTPVSLGHEHIPQTEAENETVILRSLKEFDNVNKIAQDQVLSFSETGVSIIYGGNGTGKSGYARVMKHGCRARDYSEIIRPNASDISKLGSVPSAKFEISINGKSEELTWVRDTPPPEQLSTISVFDSKCARSYLTSEQDVAYLPYGLDILERLANQVLPKLANKTDAEISKLNTDRRPFEHLIGDTQVGQLLNSLSSKTDPEKLKKLGQLSDQDKEKHESLKKILKESNPLHRASELKLSVKRLKSTSEKLNTPLKWINESAINKLAKLDQDNQQVQKSEQESAEMLRSGENLLDGTGSSVWKTLFKAAEKFSIEEAYKGKNFPYTESRAACPLCQSPINESTADRINRFNDYIKNDIAKSAEQAKNTLNDAKSNIEKANLQVDIDLYVIEELSQKNSDIPTIINNYQSSIENRRNWMMACLETHEWDNPPSLSDNPKHLIRKCAAIELCEARSLIKASDEETRIKIQSEFNELDARIKLSQVIEPVLELLSNLKTKVALENCKKTLKTKPISDKSKQLASASITKELQESLESEFKQLGIGHIKTKLKERNKRGQMFHQLILNLPNAFKLDEILSEGEQRVIALGSFLAELSLANHSCGIIFDDPVSSLDHKRRSRVAKRLVLESKKRQVIVFTHDIVFLQRLQDECAAKGVSPEILSLDWKGDSCGIVAEGLPWKHQGVSARVDALEKKQREFERLPWPAEPSEDLASQIIRQYSLLRATIERFVEDKMLNGTIQRFRGYIDVKRLNKIIGTEQSEVEEVSRLMKRCHVLIEAHDPSSVKNEMPPTPDELKSDIEAFKNLIKTVKNRQSSISS